MGRVLRLACLLGVLLACSTSGESKCSYPILVAYSFAASRNANLSMVAEYLTRTAGPELLPHYPECTSITFPARPYLPIPTDTNHLGLREQVMNDSASFIMAAPLVQACLQDCDTVPLVTTSFSASGDLAEGTLIVREGSSISSFGDLRGKSVAVILTSSPIMFLLQAQRMAELGVHVWMDLRKVFVMGEETQRWELLEQLRSGEVDAAFFTSEVTWGPDDRVEGMMHVCDGRSRPLSEAVDGMGCTKPRVDPVMLAGPFTPHRVRTAVMTALLELRENDEAARVGGFKSFRSPDNYLANARLFMDWGVFREFDDEGLRWCQMDAFEAITCPEGYQRKSREALQESCKDIGEPCAYRDLGGTACICSPCEVAFRVSVSLSKKDETPCDKMAGCFTVEHLSVQTLHVRLRNPEEHHATEAHNLTFKMDLFELSPESILEGEGVLDTGSGLHCGLQTSTESCDLFFTVPLPTGRVGNRIMAIYYNGVQIEVSPIIYTVAPVKCETGSLRLPNKAGQCVCSIDSSVDMLGRCVRMREYVPIIVAALVVLGAVAAYIYIQDFKRRQDNIWRIDFETLEFDEPPMKLGVGTFGWVLAAKYRGTEVAVKQMIPGGRGSKRCGMQAVTRSNSGNKTQFSGENTVVSPTRHASLPPHQQSLQSPFASIALDSPMSESRLLTISRSTSLRDLSDTHQSLESTNLSQAHGIQDAEDSSASGLNLMVRSRSSDQQIASRPGSSDPQPSPDQRWSDGGSGIFACLRRGLQSSRPSSLLSDFKREIRLMTKINHPNVVMVMGAVTDRHRLGPMLVMERMHFGSLENLLHNTTVFLEGDIVMHILRDIVQGMRFLHGGKPPILHGDLKSANILIGADLRAKIVDFGFSQKAKVSLAVGSPAFMAPEVLRGKGISVQSDVYSFGVTLYELFSRRHPYQGESMSTVVELVRNPKEGCGLKRPGIPLGCPQKIAELMTVCLAENPSERPSFAELDNKVLDQLNVLNLQLGAMAQSLLSRRSQLQESQWLFDVFPKRIAEALIAGRKVEPESKECVTIFFSDIVGFTSISSEMEASLVSDMLSRMHCVFDQLAKDHNVRKIETIGDAYIAVTNMEEEGDPMHAANMARFAWAVMQTCKGIYIDTNDESRGTVKLRIGIHTGPVVASVIGTQQPKFTLLGDAVNTASRMESLSVAGKIQCSKVAAQLIHEQDPMMRLVPRGRIAVKGKGMMPTFWVLGPFQTWFPGSDEFIAFHKALKEPAEESAPDQMLTQFILPQPAKASRVQLVKNSDHGKGHLSLTMRPNVPPQPLKRASNGSRRSSWTEGSPFQARTSFEELDIEAGRPRVGRISPPRSTASSARVKGPMGSR